MVGGCACVVLTQEPDYFARCASSGSAGGGKGESVLRTLSCSADVNWEKIALGGGENLDREDQERVSAGGSSFHSGAFVKGSSALGSLDEYVSSQPDVGCLESAQRDAERSRRG